MFCLLLIITDYLVEVISSSWNDWKRVLNSLILVSERQKTVQQFNTSNLFQHGTGTWSGKCHSMPFVFTQMR